MSPSRLKKANRKGESWTEKENLGTGNFLERKRTGNWITESVTYQEQPQPVNRNRWYIQKWKTRPPQNPKQDNIASNNRFGAACLNNVNYEDFTNEDENINASNPENQQVLKQQTTVLLSKVLKDHHNFQERKNPARINHKPTVPGNSNAVTLLDTEEKRGY